MGGQKGSWVRSIFIKHEGWLGNSGDPKQAPNLLQGDIKLNWLFFLVITTKKLKPVPQNILSGASMVKIWLKNGKFQPSFWVSKAKVQEFFKKKVKHTKKSHWLDVKYTGFKNIFLATSHHHHVPWVVSFLWMCSGWSESSRVKSYA